MYMTSIVHDFKKKRKGTIRVAKLICVFVFACADCWFSHEVAYLAIMKHDGEIQTVGVITENL